MGTNPSRLASSPKVRVWYVGGRLRAQGFAQICRKWTVWEVFSFCSLCAMPVPPVVNWTSPRFCWGGFYCVSDPSHAAKGRELELTMT